MTTQFLREANKQYPSLKDVIVKYQSRVNKNIEQKWVDDNMSPLIDFMGDYAVWKEIVPGVVIPEGRSSFRNVPQSTHPMAVFSGSHWTSRKAGDKDVYDPYKNHQIYGTNQFCQTFALMYLDNVKLPEINHKWLKYYDYTRMALDYIEEVISKRLKPSNPAFKYKGSSKARLLRAIKNCKKYPNICLNAIEFPSRELLY